MGAAQLVSALVLVTEGVLIGCGDLRYLLDVHCLNFVVLGGVLWWVGKTGAGLQGIWVAVFMNQALRMGAARRARLARRRARPVRAQRGRRRRRRAIERASTDEPVSCVLSDGRRARVLCGARVALVRGE